MATPGTKVLIVEDERLVALDIRHALTHLGYLVSGTAASAEEAIARASLTCPDAVLMDIRIKGAQDGIETATILRERFDVPVIYLTAHADSATIERAKHTVPYGYLTKPFTESALASAIEVAIFKHQMDRKLRDRERWFSTTLSSIGDAVVAVDLKGAITYLNPTAEKLLGVSSAQATGQLARTLIQLDAPAQPESPLDEVLQSRQRVVIREAQLKGPAGPARTISDSVSPVVADGEMLGAVMVFRDVTEEKQIQKRMALADRLASLGAMAAGVAHEVNNPLTVVVGNSTLLLDDLKRLAESMGTDNAADQARVRDMITAQVDVINASQRIVRIVDDMRTLAQQPVVQVSGQHNDVSVAVAWAVRATAHELANRATVEVETLAQDACVELDSGRLEQVLINLLVNAAHAIEPNNVEDNRVVVRTRRESDRVVLEISDTGTGMPPEVLERLFEPFFTTKGGAGTGLGLPICRSIVTSAGGELTVASQLGKGSIFRISLPEAGRATEAALNQSTATATTRRGRILMIDDEAMLLRTLPRLLPDHDVVCSQDAREALSLLEKDPSFDIVFCDLMMPNMNGMEFYEALLARAPQLAERVVFFTGGVTNSTVAEFLQVVGNDSLAKPIAPRALQAFVSQRLVARNPA